jgi:hypothetical protein
LLLTAVVTILANDGAAGQISFVSSAYLELQEPRANNQSGSTLALTLQRGPGIYGRVSVPFTVTNLFGVPSTDVTPNSGVVVFADRQVRDCDCCYYLLVSYSKACIYLKV